MTREGNPRQAKLSLVKTSDKGYVECLGPVLLVRKEQFWWHLKILSHMTGHTNGRKCTLASRHGHLAHSWAWFTIGFLSCFGIYSRIKNTFIFVGKIKTIRELDQVRVLLVLLKGSLVGKRTAETVKPRGQWGHTDAVEDNVARSREQCGHRRLCSP